MNLQMKAVPAALEVPVRGIGGEVGHVGVEGEPLVHLHPGRPLDALMLLCLVLVPLELDDQHSETKYTHSCNDFEHYY